MTNEIEVAATNKQNEAHVRQGRILVLCRELTSNDQEVYLNILYKTEHGLKPNVLIIQQDFANSLGLTIGVINKAIGRLISLKYIYKNGKYFNINHDLMTGISPRKKKEKTKKEV